MNRIKLIGINTEGALRLWYGPETKIGVFASRDFDANDSLLEPVYRKVAWHRNTKLFYGDR